ncbi:zinc finger and BTB domain-containing protein 22-like isoform X1 [Scleropages formosus]|uniref:Zinc finger and BTB domain containing 22a n=1 Tax=Scleropages formosus TaxID=113540 RepID=A0A8C9VLZ8_SCLFO|nr:zinc finger and BTB domain-containing protein 22-like isoform X1 [Scleropages formosus]
MDHSCSSSGSGIAGSVVQVSFPSVRTAVLDSLNRQREEGRLCDLSIQVQGQVFRAHRCVMAASSPYFHDQVLLKNVTTVSLPSVMDPLVFESVLSSAYTGHLSIVCDDIVNYVTVASFLQMWHIVDKCTEILKKPRVVGGATNHSSNPNSAPSRQQSPSSTDCLYTERERDRERQRGVEPKERGQAGPPTPEKRTHGPDQGSLPPLATWRRPQFPRWSRPRPATQALPPPSLPPQSSADSQLDPNQGTESDYSSCEEVWMTSSSKASPRSHDGANPYRTAFEQGSRGGTHNPTGYANEAGRLRPRVRPKGLQPNCTMEDFQKLGGRARERGSVDGGQQGFEETDGELQGKKMGERGTEADEGMGEQVEEEEMEGTERAGQSREYPTSVYQGEEAEQVDEGEDPEAVPKGEREVEKETSVGSLRGVTEGDVEALGPGSSCPGPALPARVQWQANPWMQQGSRPLEGEEEEDEEEEEEVDFGRFSEGGGVAFGGDTYDEIEDGTGQVSQRPLVPASPSDDNEYHMGPPELTWPPLSIATQSPGGAAAPGSSRHIPPASAPFPPSSSPPIPSSSSLSLAGAPYSGKVHFCHCGKAYTLKSMRDRHVKMQHLNLRPFACPVCAKTFKMKHHLTKHLKTHGGLRPYECSLCGKKVIWRDSFLRHQARCERLAAAGMPPTYDSSTSNNMNSTDMDDTYGYAFDEGEGFLSESGQVKVEESDFQGEAESAIGGLLSGVPGDGLEMGTQSRTLLSGQELKEEESERYS